VTTEPTENADDKARAERVRKLFLGPCDFVAGVDNLGAMIEAGLPEVAFAGRSNVGKSSLINALTNRNSLARTSHTPGRTQQINFFDLGGRMQIVDLPGYGYAKASKTKIVAWNDMIKQYLKGRPTLRRVCVLVDSRRGIKSVDSEIMDLLDKSAVPWQVILTKIDKISYAELEALTKDVIEVLKKHPAAFPEIHSTSASKKIGFEDLRASLVDLCI